MTRSILVLLLSLIAPSTVAASGLDPAQVVSAEACGECHASTYQVWKTTRHATGFETLHRQQSAYDIAERMGFRLIKRDSLCLQCHYTPTPHDGESGVEVRAASGVSCESCHGEGRDYIDVHNEYAGKDIDHRSESPQHRQQRIEASRAAGMRRPSDLYELVSTCYGCHTVPHEKLVNVGRHPLGSADFDLVARTLEIRHNFLDSYLNGDGTVNAERPAQHLLELAVLGRMLALEHALRGLAEASEDGVYSKAVERRLRRATTDLYQVAHAADLGAARSMVEIARAVDRAPGARQPLVEPLVDAADRVGELARGFLAGLDEPTATRLAALDPLLRGGELPFVELPAEPSTTPAADDVEPVAVAALDPAADPATEPGVDTSADTVPEQEAIPAEGERRSHLRPRSDHATLEATACQKCHGDQNAWWFEDRHYASIEPFLDRAPKNVQIARLYGIAPAEMARGDSLCMDCHGTVATARAAREVADGVSCQNCHGAAADYLDIHQAAEGEALGPQRPGYRQALQRGMHDLRDLPTAVAACASCHYVNDRRLLSAGHPAGKDFDIIAAMAKTRHWKTAVMPEADLRQAWSAVLGERGPVPEVRLARLAVRSAPVQSAPVQSAPQTTAPTATTATTASTHHHTEPAEASEAAPARSARSRPTTLPERPELDPSMPVDERLRRLQQRLEELYRATARDAGSGDETGGETGGETDDGEAG